jgi:hypothetical protein
MDRKTEAEKVKILSKLVSFLDVKVVSVLGVKGQWVTLNVSGDIWEMCE